MDCPPYVLCRIRLGKDPLHPRVYSFIGGARDSENVRLLEHARRFESHKAAKQAANAILHRATRDVWVWPLPYFVAWALTQGENRGNLVAARAGPRRLPKRATPQVPVESASSALNEASTGSLADADEPDPPLPL